MKLYHYTSVSLAGGIFNTELKFGHYDSYGNGRLGPLVWMTTSPESKGHGLLTGEDLKSSEMERLKRQGKQLKNEKTHDKTKIRIQIDSEKLSLWSAQSEKSAGLIPYEKFSKKLGEPAVFRKVMGLSCIFDVSAFSRDELKRKLKKTLTKESTWWLHFGGISPELFESVSFMTPSGFVPYEFEIHGRAEYEKIGIHVVSKSLLDEFHTLCHPINRFDVPFAALFCKAPESKPSVVFQGQGSIWSIALEEPFLVTSEQGQLPANIESISDWARRHQAELLSLWPQAIASYNRFYPSNPASM